MKPIYKSWLIQIEVTNACNHKCTNCSRFVGHHPKPYFMDLDTVAKAIESLEGYGGGIGIIGGEPTLHPQFREICELLQEKVPSRRCALWTDGYKWNEYKSLIQKTFGYGVSYNDHSDKTQRHQPILVAIDEVVEDKTLMWELIDRCWMQEKWSASINPKGGFFCEIAAAMDILFDGPGGYPIEKGWWNKTPKQFEDQVKRYCPRCSCALPLERPAINDPNDVVSKGNLEKLLAIQSPKALKGYVTVYNQTITREMINNDSWKPWNYLGEKRVRKADMKVGDSIGFHRKAKYYNWLNRNLKNCKIRLGNSLSGLMRRHKRQT